MGGKREESKNGRQFILFGGGEVIRPRSKSFTDLRMNMRLFKRQRLAAYFVHLHASHRKQWRLSRIYPTGFQIRAIIMSDKPAKKRRSWLLGKIEWRIFLGKIQIKKMCDVISTRLNIYMVINSIEYIYKLNISIVSVYLYSIYFWKLCSRLILSRFKSVSVSTVYYLY